MSLVATPVSAGMTNDADSWLFPFNSDVRAGRFLVAYIAIDAPLTDPVLTVSDSRGNVWVAAASVVQSGNLIGAYLFAAYVETALSSTFDTITVSSDTTAGHIAILVDEFDDDIFVATADQTATNAAPSATALSSGTTGTTTTADQLVVAAFAFLDGDNTFTATAPFTDNATASTGVDVTDVVIADTFRTVSATGTQAAAGTLTIASDYAAAIATFPITPTGRNVVYDVAIDWASDGTFTDAGDDISTRVLSRGGLTMQYGRDQARALSPAQVGTASFEVDNRSRDYSPDNSASPLFGMLGPGRRVRIQARFQNTTYSLFTGQLSTYDVVPDPLTRAVDFSADDLLGQLRAVEASTGLYEGIRTGDALNLLLDFIGWPIDARVIDPGATTIQWWWEEGTDCFTAAQNIVNSEGPGALFTVDPEGNALFQDRHHRILATESTSVQETFNASGTEPLFSAPLVYDVGWRDVVNRAVFRVEERRPSGRLVTVWEADPAPFTVLSGQTRQLVAEASEPFYGAVVPVQDTDFTATGTVVVTLSRTSGQTTTISFTASGGPATITELKLRAFSVTVARTRKVSSEDPTSIETDGIRDYPDEAPFAGVQDSAAIAALIVAQHSQRLPAVTFRLANANATRTVQQLERNLSDRIHIVEPESDIDRDFFIEQIQHDITEAGRFHSTTFGTEAIVTVPTDVLILDVGQLDVNRLGNFAYDDPATVFVFDDATTGRFDVGLLGT